MGSEHDGLETARADLVDRRRVGPRRHAGAESDLACGGLADASLNDVAEVDLLDDIGADTRLLERVLERNNAKLGCSKSLECAVDGPDGSAGRSNDDGLVALDSGRLDE